MSSHTSFSNEHYNLISTIYHCLSGADSCSKYIQDSRNADDKELADFFNEVKEQYEHLATKAHKIMEKKTS